MNYIALLSTPRRSIATFLLLTLISWSLGLPTFIHSARAVSLNHVSDLLSTTATSTVANHTITFTTPTGIAVDETMTITFPALFNMNGVAFGDIDITDDGSDLTVAAVAGAGTWGADVSGQVLTLTNSNDTAVGAGSVMVVEIGLNATFGVAGDTQIINPATAGTQLIAIAGTMVDSADTRVYILSDVLVTAEVQTIFEFEVAGVADTETVNGSAVDISSTPEQLAFGILTPNASSTMAQDLRVKTNAQYGFVVTVQADGLLRSDTGADINTFIDDGDTVDPVAWQVPAATIDTDTTYGHEGVTSEDDLNVGGAFGAMEYAGNFVDTPRAIFSHDGPVTWTNPGDNPDRATTRVGYTIEISPLQEAADDYTQTLWYVATPTF